MLGDDWGPQAVSGALGARVSLRPGHRLPSSFSVWPVSPGDDGT